jgi:hypothetical protein
VNDGHEIPYFMLARKTITRSTNFRSSAAGRIAQTSGETIHPEREHAKPPIQWDMYLRCCINFFFRCAAVDKIEIASRGKKFRQWHVTLYAGNNPAWLEPFKKELIDRIRDTKTKAGFEAAPDEIVFSN